MANISNELSEVSDEAFALVARELATGKTDEALWTKAFALQNGNESATKAHYIRLRVEKLQQLNESKAPDSNDQPRNTSRPSTKPAQTVEEAVVEVSLWSRLWARNIDFLICMALFLPVSFLISAQSESLIFSLVIAFVVPGLLLILYDSSLTSVFGKTIGKALFGIRVARVTGENLPFSVAWNRAFKVWAYGNSGYFVFPVLTLMTWWSARRRIQKTGTSSWDVAADSCVTQRNIGSIRNGVATAFGVLCFVTAIFISSAVKYTNKKVIRDSVIPTAEKSAPAVAQTPNIFDQFDKPEENLSDVAALSKKADAGNADAQVALGWMYTNGEVLPMNLTKAYDLFQKAALGGNADGQYGLASAYHHGRGVQKDASLAAAWNLKAAEQGYVLAQKDLGIYYVNGTGVQQNYTTAFMWTMKAAEQGNAQAQGNVGTSYANGQGVPQDFSKAVEWFQKAAAQGDETAQFNLGSMYYDGKGVPKDFAKAIVWYQKAAAQGVPGAQHNLGNMYYNGEGVPKDNVISYAYANLAASNGIRSAEINREGFSRSMTAAEIAEGQRLSAIWKMGQPIYRQ